MAVLKLRARERAEPSRAADVAGVARRLAVLLQAGLAPRAAWSYVAAGEEGPAAAVAAVARAASEGAPVAVAMRDQGPHWGDLAAAWSVATEVGAALADALRSFAIALGDAAEARDDVAVALAEPAGTARLMLWLPALGILLGAALGMDPLGVLFTDPRGLACLSAGIALVVVARLWTHRLVRAAQPPPGLPGVEAELLAIALSGGVSIDRATACVSAALCSDPARRAAAPFPELPASVRGALNLSRRAGVPAVELLRAEAAWERHRARVEGRTRAAVLGTRLLLPLGVCTLPSFLLLAVAPLVLAVLAGSDLPLT